MKNKTACRSAVAIRSQSVFGGLHPNVGKRYNSCPGYLSFHYDTGLAPDPRFLKPSQAFFSQYIPRELVNITPTRLPHANNPILISRYPKQVSIEASIPNSLLYRSSLLSWNNTYPCRCMLLLILECDHSYVRRSYADISLISKDKPTSHDRWRTGQTDLNHKLTAKIYFPGRAFHYIVGIEQQELSQRSTILYR